MALIDHHNPIAKNFVSQVSNMRSWSLSDELYRTLHQWPMISLFFLIGCLMGWLLSWIYPGNYRASATIYVALNPYRTYEDSNFLANVNPEYSNLDDYKNWQMGQLNTAIFLDEIILETLERLKEQDQIWDSVEASQLREQLIAEWRSAGKWSLVAENRDAEMAAQAAKTWGEVVYERIGFAVGSARDLISTDYEMEVAVQNLDQARSRLSELEKTRDQLAEWVSAAQGQPPEEQLDATERRQLLKLVTDLTKLDLGWIDLLDNQPTETASRDTTINWLELFLPTIEAEIRSQEENIKQLEQQQTGLEEQYAKQFDDSQGLSPNLEVERMEVDPAERIQPLGVMTLIGGICGLLLWVFKELARITNQIKKDEQEKTGAVSE